MLPVLVGLLSAVTSSSIGENECVELGFEKDLSCLSCRELADFGLKSLQTECNACCAQGDEQNVPRYQRAILEVCG